MLILFRALLATEYIHKNLISNIRIHSTEYNQDHTLNVRNFSPYISKTYLLVTIIKKRDLIYVKLETLWQTKPHGFTT